MATCVCGRSYRKGSMAFVIIEGKIQGKRVCPECARQAVPIVAPRVEFKLAPKVVRSDVVQRAIRMLTTYAKAARATANAEDNPIGLIAQGRAEGFEGAIEVLKRESGEA